MILTVASSVTVLGFLGWVLGTIFNYQGVAVIGATIIVGTGVMITSNGLEYQTGEIETETADGEIEIQNQYEQLDTPTNLPLGGLIMLLGGVLVLRSLNPEGGGL